MQINFLKKHKFNEKIISFSKYTNNIFKKRRNINLYFEGAKKCTKNYSYQDQLRLEKMF